jgi:cytochrome c553
MAASFRKYKIMVGIMLLVFTVSIQAEAPTTTPLAKTETCVACHGGDGNSNVSAWPKIAGQHRDYLLYQLIEYKKAADGLRNNPVMSAMLQQFSEQDLANLADFYAKETMTPGQTPEQYVALGEKIYRGGVIERGVSACIACHGANGIGNDLAKYPRLSGQNVEYTITQLKQYRSGERKTDPNAIMRNIAAKMTDAEIEAVSNYVAGLH